MNANAIETSNPTSTPARAATWRVALVPQAMGKPLYAQTQTFTQDGFSVLLDRPLADSQPLTVHLELPNSPLPDVLTFEAMIDSTVLQHTNPPFVAELRIVDIPRNQALKLDRALAVYSA